MKCNSLSDFIKDGIIVVILGTITFLTRFSFKSQSIDIYDVAMFAVGSDTFTPIHSPGYPVLLIITRFLDFFTKNSITSLIFISIFSSVILVIITYLVAQIFFKDRVISFFSALLILVQPSVWLFGIIGMSDMLQAACVGLVVVFCAAAINYKKNYLLFIALFLFAIALGIKISHFLLLPLILYTIIEIRPKIIDIGKSIISFLIGLFLWIVPFFTLMDLSKLNNEGLILRDAGNYNVFVIGFINKLILLTGKSAYLHFEKTTIILCLVTLSLFILFICFYLGLKDQKTLCFCIPYSMKGINSKITQNKNLTFFALWIIPYLVIFFLFFGWGIRYYLPIYPAMSIVFVWLFKSAVQLVDPAKITISNPIFKKFLAMGNIIFCGMLVIFCIFSAYVSIVTIAPYHNEVDTRSQVITYISNISTLNAAAGKDTYVYINSLYWGRMVFRAYIDYYNVSEFNSTHFIEHVPFSTPPTPDQLKTAERDLLKMMNSDSGNNSKIYLIGGLESQSLYNERVFQLKLLKTFSRTNEWIIDDPQGEIQLYEYEDLGNSIWPEIQNSLDSSKYSLINLKTETMEDDVIYQQLFDHAPEKGQKIFNVTLNIPDDESKNNLKFKYGFVKGANQTDGVIFSILLNGVRQFSETKQYTGKLSTYDLDLTKYHGENVTLSLIVDPNGNNAFDWSAWVIAS